MNVQTNEFNFLKDVNASVFVLLTLNVNEFVFFSVNVPPNTVIIIIVIVITPIGCNVEYRIEHRSFFFFLESEHNPYTTLSIVRGWKASANALVYTHVYEKVYLKTYSVYIVHGKSLRYQLEFSIIDPFVASKRGYFFSPFSPSHRRTR